MARRNIILIAENQRVENIILNDLFKGDYRIMCCSGHEEAVRKYEAFRRQICCVIFTDRRPALDSELFCDFFHNKGYIDDTPLVILSADITSEKAHDLWQDMYTKGVMEIVQLPFDPYYLKQRVKKYETMANNYIEQKSNFERMQALEAGRTNSLITIIGSVFELIQFEPPTHIKRVKHLTNILASRYVEKYPECKLTEQEVEWISSAAEVHDIGKAAIPTNILFKPGKLTSEEYDTMKTHTERGIEILQDFGIQDDHPFFRLCYEISMYHHERWDGRGYPKGLKEDEIPLAAQLVSIVDVYDALVSERVYKSAIPYEKAVNMIKDGECGLFPPKVVETFNEVENDFRKYTNMVLSTNF